MMRSRSCREDRDEQVARRVRSQINEVTFEYIEKGGRVTHTEFFAEGRSLGKVEGKYSSAESFVYEQGLALELQ